MVFPDTRPVALTLATAGAEDTHGSTAAGLPVPANWEVLPLQNVSEPLIVGIGLTTIVSVVLVVHCPAFGVKV